jgi:hypothetical protein
LAATPAARSAFRRRPAVSWGSSPAGARFPPTAPCRSAASSIIWGRLRAR